MRDKLIVFMSTLAVSFVALAQSPMPAQVPTQTEATTDVTIPTASPADKAMLNAIMKHPTEPNFDRLRPLSGRWVRCLSNEGGGATQEIYSSSDRDSFTVTSTGFQAPDCKDADLKSKPNPVDRQTFDCQSANKKSLSCRQVNLERSMPDGTWVSQSSTLTPTNGKRFFLEFKKSKVSAKVPPSQTLQLIQTPLTPGSPVHVINLVFMTPPSAPTALKTTR